MVPLPLLAPEPYLLPLALLAFGAAGASMDVSMNAHGSAIEGRLGRPIMSSLHAGWSFGGFAGAAGVAAATAAGVDPRLQNSVAAVLLAARCSSACLTGLGPGSATAAGERFRLPSRARRPDGRPVLPDRWSPRARWPTGAASTCAGTSARRPGWPRSRSPRFAAGMTVGRLTGDWINQQIGPTRLLRGGSALAAIALGTMLVLADPIVALAGLALVGVGVANGVPLLFSAAGAGGVETSGPSIAAVSSMGSLGFLVGPPFIGFLAEATTLPLALTSLCAGDRDGRRPGPRVTGRARRPEPELAVR